MPGAFARSNEEYQPSRPLPFELVSETYSTHHRTPIKEGERERERERVGGGE